MYNYLSEMREKKAVIFLNTHRCGTKGLCTFFEKKYPEIYSVHQPIGSRRLNVLTTLFLYNYLNEKVYNKYIVRTRINKIKVILNNRTYLQTDGFNLIAAKYIYNFIPNTILIHIIRDPRTWILSYMSWVKTKFKSKIAYKFLPFWNILPYRLGYVSKQQWKNYDEFEKFCWWWRIKNEIIINNYESLDIYNRYRFEDLIINRDTEKWRHLLAKLELSYKDGIEDFFINKINSSKETYVKKSDFWNSERKKSLESICGSLMEKFGYI